MGEHLWVNGSSQRGTPGWRILSDPQFPPNRHCHCCRCVRCRRRCYCFLGCQLMAGSFSKANWEGAESSLSIFFSYLPCRACLACCVVRWALQQNGISIFSVYRWSCFIILGRGGVGDVLSVGVTFCAHTPNACLHPLPPSAN